jgi:hypothetical protein
MPDNLEVLTVALPSPLTVATIESLSLPENADIAAVTVGPLTTAPVGSAAVFDVLDGGVSLFATAMGVVHNPANTAGSAAPSLTTSSTTLVIDASNVGLPPKKGQVLTIDSEDVVVTSEGGSPLTTGGGPSFQVTITRAANGTTAATHAAGVSVFPAKPKVAAGTTSSAGIYAASPKGNTPEVVGGDSVAVSCLVVGSTTAGGGGQLVLELAQR